jgi:uncharacterized pyridoxamine 5'-phosphate oxidase family protein
MHIISADPETRPLSEDEVMQLLRGVHIMQLGLVDAKGFPVIRPVWFLYENDRLYTTTDHASAKVRYIEQNANVYYSIDLDKPISGVRGRARARIERAAEVAVDITRQSLLKYTRSLDHDLAREFMQAARDGETWVIEIEPLQFATWGS